MATKWFLRSQVRTGCKVLIMNSPIEGGPFYHLVTKQFIPVNMEIPIYGSYTIAVVDGNGDVTIRHVDTNPLDTQTET